MAQDEWVRRGASDVVAYARALQTTEAIPEETRQVLIREFASSYWDAWFVRNGWKKQIPITVIAQRPGESVHVDGDVALTGTAGLTDET